MAITLITVTGSYPKAPSGAEATGKVLFKCTSALQDSASKEIYPAVTYEADLSAGSISISLPANDDSTTQPQGSTYQVTEKINGAAERVYNVVVPHGATGGTIDLSTLAPTESGTVTYGISTFNGRSGPAVTLEKADITATGLSYSDVGADASGAAATAQTNAESYTDSKVSAETSRAEAAEAQRILYRGAWQANTAYDANDQVTEGGNVYVCTTAHTSGATFSGADWTNLTAGPPTSFPSALDPSGSPAILALEAKVGVDGSAVTSSLDYEMRQRLPLTGGTISPPSTASGVVIDVPAYAAGSGYAGVTISDSAATSNAAELLGVNAYGKYSNVGALDLKAWPGMTGIAFSAHNYAPGALPFVEWDNCTTAKLLALKNTENGNNSPGNNAFNSKFLEFQGYATPTTSSNGVVTNGNTLTDTTTPAAFVAQDVGKSILVGSVLTTIASVVSATQITTASSSLVNGSGVTYEYIPVSGVGAIGSIAMDWSSFPAGFLCYTADNPVAGFEFTTLGGTAVALTITQPSGSNNALNVVNSGSGSGIKITNTGSGLGLYVVYSGTGNASQINNSGGGAGLYITQTSAHNALVLDASTSGAAGAYPLWVKGYNYGPRIDVTTGSGTALYVNDTSTGSGTVVQVTNKGTGPSLQVDAGSSYLMQVLASGALNFASSLSAATATAGSATLPANPVGFITMEVNGVTAKVPYYAA